LAVRRQLSAAMDFAEMPLENVVRLDG